jgi:membrane fusion protein (multidrug efflux system)
MLKHWKQSTAVTIAGLALAQILLTGCKKAPAAAAGGPPGGGMPAMQVVAVEAKAQPVTESLSLIGSIAANESVELKAETEGIVQEILFDEGKPVEKGQLLVRLDDTKLAASVAEAESNFKLSTANFERAKQLLKDTLISQQEYDQAAATFDLNRATTELKQRQLKDTRIYAPFAGVTSARNVSPGQVIMRDTVLTTLVDLDPVKVEVNVPERYLQRLSIGQALEFSVAAFPGQKFRGEVYFISPQLNENLRTALVKARIPNADHKLRGGMFASLDLTLQVRDAAIVIPEPALMSNGDNFSVFVVDAESKAQLRPVEVGIRLAGKVEVMKGLKAGEKVIVEGVQKVGPGALVKLAPAERAEPYAGQ